jgi:hypothetical protein
MLAYHICIDGERVALAGVDDWAVLSAHVTAVRERCGEPLKLHEVEFSVGGLSRRDGGGAGHHVRWKTHELGIGSEVRIRLVDTETPDEPLRRYRSDREVQESPFTAEEIEEFERAEWLRLKAKFEGQ